jgi:DNA-binding protein Fis
VFHKMLLEEALAAADHNQCKMAEVHGLHRNTISRRLREFKIDPRGAWPT